MINFINYWNNMKSSLHNLEGAEGGDYARKLDGRLRFQKGITFLIFFGKQLNSNLFSKIQIGSTNT